MVDGEAAAALACEGAISVFSKRVPITGEPIAA